jgi:hypothetical protein
MLPPRWHQTACLVGPDNVLELLLTHALAWHVCVRCASDCAVWCHRTAQSGAIELRSLVPSDRASGAPDKAAAA